MGWCQRWNGVCRSIPCRRNSTCEGFWQEEAWEGVWSIVEGHIICKGPVQNKSVLPC